tara:strand:- start:757 stop:1146 length:390 start_codon:yes stop_codon:yes gene_type:complete
MWKHTQEEVLTDAYISDTDTVTSSVTDLTLVSQLGYQLSVSEGGDAAGTASIQISADYDKVLGTGTWTALPTDFQYYNTVALTAGAFTGVDGYSAVMTANSLPFKAARISYTNTSGDGYLSAVVNCKDV